MGLNVGWSLGSRCPFSCQHCYTRDDRTNVRDLDASDIARVVEFASVNNVEHVTLGGNEPWFSGSDGSLLPEIIEQLIEHDIRASLVTSGPSALRLGAVRPDLLDALDNVAVSLDAPAALEHNASRGASLWSLAQKVLRQTTTATRRPLILWVLRADSTPGQIDSFAEVARDLGAYFRINLLKPNSAMLESLYPAPSRVVEVMERVEQRFNRVLSTDILLDPLGARASSCPCGTSTFRIGFKEADGEIPIHPCQYHRPDAEAPVTVSNAEDVLAEMRHHPVAVGNREVPGCATLREFVGAETTGRGRVPEAVPRQLRGWLNYLPTWIGEPR